MPRLRPNGRQNRRGFDYQGSERVRILEKYLDALVRASVKNRPLGRKIIAIILGGFTFLIVIPFLLFLAGYALERFVSPSDHTLAQIAFSLAATCVGLVMVGWTTLTQLNIGRGTPVPLVPTQKLIVSGPYKLCRNPIQLGAMLYYPGIGMIFGSVEIGVVMLILTFILGTCYHKFVEEKELLLRFGPEYEEYKARTPFLLPKM
jgi:protein-S-isoprenylcysteine O-methyltransferase Ste14